MEETVDVRVCPAGASEQTLLANLLELYVHDFSELVPCEIGEDGRFGFPELAAYGRDPRRLPFLIRADGGPAGFALVDRGSKLSDDPDVTDMAQFFVLRGWRRRGVGRTAAHAVFRAFPGPWEVRVLEVNVVALPFWERTIGGLAENRLTRARCARPDGSFWQVFRFSC